MLIGNAVASSWLGPGITDRGCLPWLEWVGSWRATVHSPLLAMIMIFELSLNYSMMPALMLSCAVAALVSGKLYSHSVYTAPLHGRGLDLDTESSEVGAALQRTVGDLMREPVKPVPVAASLREIADRFLSCTNNYLPVVDRDQKLVGIVALHDLKEHLNSDDEIKGVIAYDIMAPPPPCLTPNQRLVDVLPIILAGDLRNIPVVNTMSQMRLVGIFMASRSFGENFPLLYQFQPPCLKLRPPTPPVAGKT